MGTPHDHEGRKEGESRKRAAHALLEAHRTYWVRRGRRALVAILMERGTATADDVAERLGELPDDLDPRLLGVVPGPLALAGLIRPIGYPTSTRASRHASRVTLWELVGEHSVARAWLDAHPELPEPPPQNEDGDGVPSPSTPPPSPSLSQAVLF